MKTEQIGNLVLVLVLLTAIGGISFMYAGIGRAGDFNLEEIQMGNYACIDASGTVFIKPAGITQPSEEHGKQICSESGTNAHPVSFFAIAP